jgi:hypothetical protein
LRRRRRSLDFSSPGPDFLRNHNSDLGNGADFNLALTALGVVDDDTDDETVLRRRPTATEDAQLVGRKHGVAELSTLLGQGWIDPFQIYPTDATRIVHEVIDHAVRFKWPNISPAKMAIPEGAPMTTCRLDGGPFHPVKRAWLQCIMEHPVAFYALAYASSQHLDWLREVGTFAGSDLLRLSYKTEAVRLINKELRELNGQSIPDYIVISILSLGAHGKELSASSPRSSTSSPDSSRLEVSSFPRLNYGLNPMCKAQMIHFYGSMSQEAAHMSALRTLIAHNNGIEGIKMPALRGAVELGDILNSTITHQRPCVPVPRPMPRQIEAIYSEPTCHLRLKTTSLPPSKRQSAALIQCFKACRAFTAALKAHVSSPHSSEVTVDDLVLARNSIHYDLLSLPTANGFWGPRYAIYEALRLASLIYSDFVLFPLPQSTGLKRRYAAMLSEALGCCWLHEEDGDKGWCTQAEPLLWCCVMGGLAAAEAADADDGKGTMAAAQALCWERAKACADHLGLFDWEEVEDCLQGWLWWKEYLGGVAKACFDWA